MTAQHFKRLYFRGALLLDEFMPNVERPMLERKREAFSRQLRSSHRFSLLFSHRFPVRNALLGSALDIYSLLFASMCIFDELTNRIYVFGLPVKTHPRELKLVMAFKCVCLCALNKTPLTVLPVIAPRFEF